MLQIRTQNSDLAAVDSVAGCGRPCAGGRLAAILQGVRLAELRQIAADHHGLFTRRHARECGFSEYQIRHRLHRGEWQVVLGPVLAPAGTRVTPWLRDVAAQLAVPGAVLAGPSAARLHGLDPPAAPSCAVVARGYHRRLPGLRLLREPLDSEDLVVVDGILLTSRPRTVFDCLRLYDDADAAACLDRALLLGWTTLDNVARRVRAHAGRRGAPRLARLVGQAAAGARSAAERLLLPLLRDARIQGWRPNFPVHSGGRMLAIVDLAFPDRRIAIEVDGWAYHHMPERFQSDRRRQNRLVAAGWTVLRFTWRDLTDRPDEVVATIIAVLRTS